MTMNIRLIGTGSALPQTRLTNAELIAAQGLESSDEWIRERTGITQRYFVKEGESTFTLARDAAERALQNAGIEASQVGAIIVATCTPDLTFPSVATMVQGALGFPNQGMALDVNAACSGFVHALAVANGILQAMPYDYALVIGAETFSNLLDFNDRTTCVLFGDGAGAVVLKKEQGNGKGILGFDLGADGTKACELQSTNGVARGRTAGTVLMNGREVYKHAVRQMGSKDAVAKVLEPHGLSAADINWVVPHQANLRIIEAAAQSLGLPIEKVVVTVDQHANTSAATIPLALDVAARDGRLKQGDLVMLQAFGAGFAWSTAALYWG
ncbi:MAG: ketoacyl-ACP synthase III [Blastochloris viridis]|uniref:Beta-ketoacyl-[acyl-carrier-protein] synthase III n=1 Tax=Blastochloris viridis TaxID=1079 RepID=A0A6N4RE60_BLAVI|nr:MAG: ketoacyl-ACP synthase III [Blastochloris viridis]